MKRACVIGGGFGGLALAIRLQAGGIATTLVEAREQVGGCAQGFARDGFTFDTGPGAILDPSCLEELWALGGQKMAEDLTLSPVNPFTRLHWADGTSFDYSSDEVQLRAEVARIAPADLAGYEDYARYSAEVHAEAYVRLGHRAITDLSSMAQVGSGLLRHQAWRSLYGKVASLVRSEKLREALSFPTLMVGGNPMSASAVYALIHQLEKDGGVWWPMGGMQSLPAAMAALFERLGGTLRLGEPVTAIHTIGNRAHEVEGASGWRERFDAVASNADLMHTYRQLLGHTQRGQAMAQKLTRRRWSPGVFSVYFGLEGSWPGLPHQMLLFGPRFSGLLDDIFEHGVLPRDFVIALQHPSITDPAMAPPGKSSFIAHVPVAHLGKLPIDWSQVGPLLEKRVLDEVGMRFIPDIHDRIVTRAHYTPQDRVDDFSTYKGSAFSLEPTRSQSLWRRAHNRDDGIPNLYFVGAGIHPGAGIPAVVNGAKATAALMIADLRI